MPSKRTSGRLPVYRLRAKGLTLAEAMVVMVLAGLLVSLVGVPLRAMLARGGFRGQIHDFVSTMQMAVRSAAESDRHYEVIVDIPEQSYLLREITTPVLSQVLEEEIIAEKNFSENCYVAYVEFDDGDWTNEGRAKFRAGRLGWQFGGKIVLLDKDDRPYSVVVNRLNGQITVEPGDVELLYPKTDDEMNL